MVVTVVVADSTAVAREGFTAEEATRVLVAMAFQVDTAITVVADSMVAVAATTAGEATTAGIAVEDITVGMEVITAGEVGTGVIQATVTAGASG